MRNYKERYKWYKDRYGITTVSLSRVASELATKEAHLQGVTKNKYISDLILNSEKGKTEQV